jgi:hypothetical protein
MRFVISCTVFFVTFSIAFTGPSHDLAANEVFAVGNHGLVNLFDGSEWSTISDNTFSYNAMWAFSETNVYAAASNGHVYQYDGASWSSIGVLPEGATREIWAASPTEIYVAGDDGMVYFYNGSYWANRSIPSGPDINSIWGTSKDNVYVACEKGGYRYTNYTSWQPLSWPSEYDDEEWNAVWCGGWDELFFMSYANYLHDLVALYYDGSEWSTIQVPEERLECAIYDMWGIPGEVVYAVGADGTVLRYDVTDDSHGGNKRRWFDVSYPYSTALNDVSGTTDGNVYARGAGLLYIYRNSNWETNYSIPTTIREIFALPGDTVLCAGGYGEFGCFKQDEYEKWAPIVDGNLEDVWAAVPDNVYVVSDNGGIYNYDGSSWTEMAKPTSWLRAIWGSSWDNIYVGGDGTYHFDGENWNQIGDQYIVDMWCTSSGDLYLIGPHEVYHYDGSEMNLLYTIENITLQGIWACDTGGLVYVIGHDKEEYSEEYYFCYYNVYEYDGSNWDIILSEYNLCGLYTFPTAIWGSNTGRVFATACSCWIYDGESWSVEWGMGCATDIWGSASDDVYFSSFLHGVWYYDGTDFTNILKGEITFNAVWGTGGVTPADIPISRSSLSQNHPNPFNPSTTISFSLRERGHASLAVYDVAGRLVRILAEGVMEAGPREVTWDGRDRNGRAVASGVYFYRLETGVYNETRKMVLLR